MPFLWMSSRNEYQHKFLIVPVFMLIFLAVLWMGGCRQAASLQTVCLPPLPSSHRSQQMGFQSGPVMLHLACRAVSCAAGEGGHGHV